MSQISYERWDHAAALSAAFLLLLLEMGALPPAFPCVPHTSLTLLSIMLNTQQLCRAFQAGFTFHLEQGHATCLSKMPLQSCSRVLLSYLSDILWTSFLSCRKHPGSASVVYTWQLCSSEGWLELEGAGEAARPETSVLRRSLLTTRKRRKQEVGVHQKQHHLSSTTGPASCSLAARSTHTHAPTATFGQRAAKLMLAGSKTCVRSLQQPAGSLAPVSSRELSGTGIMPRHRGAPCKEEPAPQWQSALVSVFHCRGTVIYPPCRRCAEVALPSSLHQLPLPRPPPS